MDRKLKRRIFPQRLREKNKDKDKDKNKELESRASSFAAALAANITSSFSRFLRSSRALAAISSEPSSEGPLRACKKKVF